MDTYMVTQFLIQGAMGFIFGTGLAFGAVLATKLLEKVSAKPCSTEAV